LGQIDNLIAELQELRKKLQTNSNRIQRDITEHAELNQQVIISESVKKLPVSNFTRKTAHRPRRFASP